MTTLTETEAADRLTSMVAGFETAMVTTRGPSGLRARPMRLITRTTDGETALSTLQMVTFVTSRRSSCAEDALRDPEVCVTLQSGEKYVYLSGLASLSDDRNRIARLWETSWGLWFPRGREDSDIVLIDCALGSAEFWDRSGLQGVSFLISAGRALFGQQTVELDHSGVHAALSPTTLARRTVGRS